MEIRTKDKVFLAFFLPVAIVGAYFYLWRIDAAKTLDSLEKRHLALVAVEDFPLEKRIREARVAEAENALAAAKAIPDVVPQVVGDADESVAKRERDVMNALTDAGLTVMRSEAVTEMRTSSPAVSGANVSPCAAALAATGSRPAPVCRRYTLDGSYPAVKRALDSFCRKRMAAMPERLIMRPSGFARWTLEIWL